MHQRSMGTHGSTRFVISGADDTLIRSVHQYHFLTKEQVCRRFYSPASVDYVRIRLKRLCDAGYLQRLQLPSVGVGNTSYIYTLARKGINYLQADGMTEFAKFRPSDQLEHSHLFLRHTLALNDLLIAAALVAEEVPEIELAEMRHERMLKRTPVRVDLGAGEHMAVVPDGWVDFHIQEKVRMSIVLELDRGTEEEKQWKRKLRALLAYASGPYQAFFGTNSLSIAFATTAGIRRVARMKTWTEQVLKQQQAEVDAELFLLTSLPTGELDPKSLYLGPVWDQPFGTHPVSLLSVS